MCLNSQPLVTLRWDLYYENQAFPAPVQDGTKKEPEADEGLRFSV